MKDALDAFVDKLMEDVTGEITLKLYKGSATLLSRSAPRSLYSQEMASFRMNGYSAQDAAGFVDQVQFTPSSGSALKR